MNDVGSKKISDALYKAADILATRGLHKGGYFESSPTEGKICGLAACGLAAGANFNSFFPFHTSSSGLALIVIKHVQSTAQRLGLRSVNYYNDLPETSLEDVILLLKQAAHDAEENS